MENKEERKCLAGKLRINIKTDILKQMPRTKLNLEDCDSVGKQIKYYREKKEWTQNKLAQCIHVTRRVILDAENKDYITLNNIYKIEEALGVQGKIKLDEYYLFIIDNPVEKLKQYMNENKIMVKTLAEITGINRHTISHWFCHKDIIARRSFEKLKKCGIIDKLIY